MTEETTHPPTAIWHSLSPLATVTLTALSGGALASFWLLLLTGEFTLALFLVTLALMLGAGVVALRRRWTPLAGTLLGAGTLLSSLFQPYTKYHLSHPSDWSFFAASVLLLAFGLAALVAGTSAALQNYRAREQHAPRWLSPALTTLAGLVIGALLVAAIPQAAPAASTSTTTNSEPTVHMGPGNFTPPTVSIPQGSKLLIVDDGSFLHILANGTWEQNRPKPQQEQGAPLVNNVQVNGNAVEIGPFTTPGTFHLYCTVHPGMTLTVIVL